MSGLGAFAAVGAAVLCLAFSPKVNSETFTPKFAVLLLFAAVGLVPLARLVLCAFTAALAGASCGCVSCRGARLRPACPRHRT